MVIDFFQALPWIVALCAIFWALGSHDANRRPIEFTQTVTQENHNGGSGQGGCSGWFGLLVPVIGIGAVTLIVVSAFTSVTQSAAQSSAVSQKALETQTEVIRSMPTPAPPVVIEKPTVVTPPISIADVATIITSVGVLALAGAFLVSVVKSFKRSAQRSPTVPPTFSVPSAREVFGRVEERVEK